MSATARVLAIILLSGSAFAAEPDLAKRILADTRLTEVIDRAKAVVATGFSAGSGYGEVWIRDFNTFMELACAVYPKETVAERLLLFFHFQGDDGNIVDGYIPRAQAQVSYKFRESPTAPDYLAHKNTVETDQESSLVIGVSRYVTTTNDKAFLDTVVNGETVAARLDRALDYVRLHRFDEKHGLVWGATTADWGDVQPEHEWGVELDASSHRAIDIYDNALYLSAIDAYIQTLANEKVRAKWLPIREQIAEKVRAHLWDAEKQKFIPHLYLEGSPFPEDFDENTIYYHGGTAVAIEADLLSRDEVAGAIARMRQNMEKAGAASIGLTMFPAYPEGFFRNTGMGPYHYQNGGDWTWFGARMIRQMIQNGFVEEAFTELMPMVDRVIANDGFFEWYSVSNEPRGSGSYRGEAGVLYSAIADLLAWARANDS